MTNPEQQQQQSIIDWIGYDLCQVMGPLAHSVIAEKMNELTAQTEFTPETILQLIELSGLEIIDENKRAVFQRAALTHYDQFRRQNEANQ